METIETNHIIDFSNRLYKLVIAFVVIGAVFLAGYLIYQFQALPQNAPREVSISGEGKAFAKPDVAMVSFGVTSQAAKSQDAVNQNNQKMNAIIAAVKNLGVEDKDIQTTLYNLSPIYGSERPLPYPYPQIENKITGYSLQQQVEVKIRNFDKINDILDKATSNGANTVGSLQFMVDDIEKARSEARAKAIAQAKEKASALFKQSGLHIKKLVNVSEGYQPIPLPFGQGYAGVTLEKSVAPNIQTGQMEIDSTVTLTYQVK